MAPNYEKKQPTREAGTYYSPEGKANIPTSADVFTGVSGTLRKTSLYTIRRDILQNHH